jgi:hypothetical protein
MADERRLDIANQESFEGPEIQSKAIRESFGSKDGKEINSDVIELSDDRTFLPSPMSPTPC